MPTAGRTDLQPRGMVLLVRTGEFDSEGLVGDTNIATEYGIAVKDEILGRAIAGERLAQLFDAPVLPENLYFFAAIAIQD
jgi:hypothetical protein